jgi:hypothetical protein
MPSASRQIRAFDRPQSPEAELAICREALLELANLRDGALADAAQASRRIADLLPRAVMAGVSVVDAAELTGVSRPTLYRMLAENRQREPLRDLAARFERALDCEHEALPNDLAVRLQTSLDAVFEHLMRIYPLVAEEFSSLGQPGLTTLVEILPELGVPERLVLAMLMLQGLSVDRVARSVQLPEMQVLGWATLGLLRTLPRLRKELPDAERASAPDSAPNFTDTGPTTIDHRYRVGDPRRHRSFTVR